MLTEHDLDLLASGELDHLIAAVEAATTAAEHDRAMARLDAELARRATAER